MPKVEIVKHIKAPQEKVWDFISDIEQAPDWVVVMQSLVETTDNPVKEGTIYRERSKVGPKESETVWRVTKFKHPHLQVHECNAPDFRAKLAMEVENKDGESVLKHTTEYALMPVFRPLGWLIESLVVKKQMIKNLHQSVENCKQMIEQE